MDLVASKAEEEAERQHCYLQFPKESLENFTWNLHEGDAVRTVRLGSTLKVNQNLFIVYPAKSGHGPCLIKGVGGEGVAKGGHAPFHAPFFPLDSIHLAYKKSSFGLRPWPSMEIITPAAGVR